MCHLTKLDVLERNRQYKELMMSKNEEGASVPKTYKVQTLDDKTNEWVDRMDSVSETYLDSVGRRWVSGKFCSHFRVVEK